MKFKRALATVLSICVAITFMPLTPVSAETTVTYKRDNPEVAILNAINGNSTQFYNKLLSSQKDANGTYYTDKATYSNKYAYLNYNSANKFHGVGAGDVDYEDQIFGSTNGALKYKFKDYDKNSVLYKLGNVDDNLEANLSVTFHNNKHAHSANLLQDEWLTAYTGVLLYANGQTLAGGYGSSELSYAKFRIGNYEFHELNSNSQDSMMLLVSASKLAYSKGTCTCFSYADNTVVAFRDTRAPKIQSVMGNIDSDGYFQKGDKITIEITFDEPIRFADDSAAGKDNLGVELMLSKSSEGSWPVAKLTKLDGATLYFEYTVPTNSTINDQITGISLKSLAGSDIKLVQVKGSDNFEITAPDGEDSNGYSTTSCYITDLAGNPALTGKEDSNAVKSLSAYIDTQGPAPVKMDVSAETNNSDIKDTLGKTDSSAKDYKDKSDYYLGAGDTLHYTIYMDELLAGLPKKTGEEDVPKYPYSNDYSNFHAKTNLYDADGVQVVLKSRFYYSNKTTAQQWGLGASNGCVTAFDMDYLTITEGMQVKENGKLVSADGKQIKITEVYFTDDSENVISIKDYCGNTASGPFDVTGLNTAKFYVDTEPPEITTSAETTTKDGKTYYTPIEDNTEYGTGFKIPITINDSSDVDGLNGRFMWRNDTSENSDKYKFKYAITGSEKAPEKDSDSWKDGIMTTQYSFTQISGTMYVHICPVNYEGKASNITDSTLLISGSDYAGNQGSLYAYTKSNGVQVEKKCAELSLDWQLDGVAPEATGAYGSKQLDANQNGVLTLGIKLTDSTGLKEAKYIWADANEAAPNEKDERWQSMTESIENQKEATGEIITTVTKGTDFSKVLWIKVSDIKGNTLIKSMGESIYRLTGVDYSISYSDEILPGAAISLLRADNTAAAALVFMVKVPKSDDEYFVRVLGAKAGNINTDLGKVFTDTKDLVYQTDGKALAWTRMKVTKSDESYTFVKSESSDKSYIDSIIKGTYSGNLDVTVISGLQTAFKWDETEKSMPLEAGTTNTSSSVKTDTVSLRISSNAPSAENAFENVDESSGPVKLTLMSELPTDTTLSTLEGLEFKVEIGADKNGWSWEDVDYANSYIAIREGTSGSPKKVKLSSTPSQTVVISEDDFPENSESGNYYIWLEIACSAGKDYSTKDDNAYKLFVDTTPASTQFAIDSVSYKPYMWKKSEKRLYSIGEYNNPAGLSLKITPVGSKTEKQTAGEDGAITEIEEIVQDKASNILYLPTSPGGETTVADKYVNYLNLSAEDIDDKIGSNYGSFDYKIWNLTSGVALTESEKNAFTAEGTSGVVSVPIKTVEDAAAYDAAAAESDKTFVYLIDGTVNTIAVQVVKANGRDSEIKYYNICPTSSVATGTASVTTLGDGLAEINVVSGGYVMFEPAKGADMSDAHVYATVDGNGNKVIELFADASGKYKAELLDGTHSYWVHTIDKYGNINPISKLTDIVDTEGPEIECTNHSCTDGHYEATFKITDTTLNPYRYYDDGAYSIGSPKNIDISLTIDDEHAEAIGLTSGAQTNIHTDWDEKKLSYNTEGEPQYSWTLSQTSANGIYEASWVMQNFKNGYSAGACYIELTVKGVVGYDSKIGEDAQVNFDLNIEASDIFGNTGTAKVSYTNADNVKPHTTAQKFVKSDNSFGNTGKSKSLQLSFNVPVQPDASWILPEPEGYSSEQKEAFPITQNGSYDIGFTDMFGNHWTQTIDITGFTEGQASDNNGIELNFSTTDLTKEAVEISAKALSKDNSKVKMIFLERKSDYEKGGYSWSILNENEDANAGTLENEKKIKISENKDVFLLYYDDNVSKGDYWTDLYETGNWVNWCQEAIPIYIRNIANEAPSAKLHFYFEEYGDTYTADKLPRDKGSADTTITTGAVTVSYSTSRAVSPINGTGSSVSFRYGDTQTSYTFEYVDAAGNQGSVTVDLAALGIRFAEPPVPYVDRNAPIVNVDVMAKRFGTYRTAEAFSARTSSTLDSTLKVDATNLTTAGVKSAFDNTTYVQDYNLKLNIEDESDFKILLMKKVPSGTLSFDSTTGDVINSVKVSGNIVNISKDAVTNLTDSDGNALTSFTVAVIDSENNYTYFTVNKSDIVDWFDNQAPTAAVEVKAETSLYSRTVYVSITDTQDSTDADDKRKTNPNGATVNGLDFEKVSEILSKKVYTDNDKTTITYYDIVGNTGSATIAVDDIDTEAPILTTTWSPGAEMKDSAGKVSIDEKNPTTGPVSTAVTATVESSRPIQDGTVEIFEMKNGSEYWNIYKLSELSNVAGDDNESLSELIAEEFGVELSYTAERVTARFIEDGVRIRVTVTALNGRSSNTSELEIKDGVIKTEAAALTITQTALKRDSYSTPYAVEITIAPSDPAYCQTDTAKDSKIKKQYSSENPFKTTVYKDGTYQYTFVDKAGNVSVASVKVDSGIDNTAPVLTADPENTIGLALTNNKADIKISSNEAVHLTWKASNGHDQSKDVAANGSTTISFTANGTYRIEATDSAGNTSSKYVSIGNISKIAPTINFDKSTLSVRQGTAKNDAEFVAQLEVGVHCYSKADSEMKVSYTYNLDKVDLNTVGTYDAVYTATDAAGNKGTATRYIKVFAKDLPTITIDGEPVDNESTYALEKGEHTLLMSGLKEITSGESEPYTVKFKKGKATKGQMKYFESTVEIDQYGRFTLNSKGFYTIYIVTQSRQDFIATLYVE